MSDSMITKQALAASIKELMEHKPLAKISVGDITSRCGVNRQTFYYHFKDKYELVNWIYYTETVQYMSSLSSGSDWTRGLEGLCHYMQANRKFYINALNTPGQNSFQEYLTQFIFGLVHALAEELLEGRPVPNEDLDFVAWFYSFALVGLVMRWAQHGMQEDPKEYIMRTKELVDASLERELRKYDMPTSLV